MLENILAPLPGFEVCRIETERPGPSYTVDTLAELSALYPKARLGFIMGGEDFALLPTWNRWEQIPELADIIVLPRGDNGEKEFFRTANSLWPGAIPQSPLPEGIHALLALPHGGRILYLPQPRLEISSSLLRERWNRGKNLHFLTPHTVIDLLEANRATVSALWQAPQAACGCHRSPGNIP